jgi:thymidylate synthase (FAD)
MAFLIKNAIQHRSSWYNFIIKKESLSMSGVKLIHITPDAEKHIAYCARVSSPNQENPEFSKLIKYLIKHKHWSPLEMASMCVEITTSRAISPQILRHRSFSFQEFSQRYSAAQQFEIYDARRQDEKNKQNSIDDLSNEVQEWFHEAQSKVIVTASELYSEALNRGIAKECARSLLPLNTTTKLYMHGTVRSFVHYVQVRADVSTQLEHREIAEEIKKIMIQELPTIASALEWP